MKSRLRLIGLVITTLLLFGCIHKTKKVDNLCIFAKAYGYVKYFHPSDEAAAINWTKFSAFGAKEIEKCSSVEQVVQTLNRLFNPIAPSVRFYISQIEPTFDMDIITPDDSAGYSIIYWQHQGVNINMKFSQPMIYKSARVNSEIKHEQKIFEARPQTGTTITKNIGKDIYCQIPQVLYCNEKGTYPQADKVLLKQLNSDLDKFDFNLEELSLRTGNVINTFNVFQHFYPYFDVVDVNWENELSKALMRCFTDKTMEEHLITLQKFTAPLKDGHVSVNYSSSKFAAPSIRWEWIEDKLVITHNYNNNPNINVGDIVTQINGISSVKYFKEIYSRISAGTKGWLNHRAEMLSLLGTKGSSLKLKINNELIEVQIEDNPYDFVKALTKYEKQYKQFDDSIWYLNMDMIEMDTINKLIPELEKCKAIICDARGYPKDNRDFITHLMKTNDTTSAWMRVPQIIYPDHENIKEYKKYNWIPLMNPKQPYLGNKKIVYIIDGSAISAAESLMGYIEGYKLATIVGQPTAGTNGNINPFDLPGGFMISWTGMKVLKHNGSQHHGIGILPDVYVSKTIQGIKEGRDEFLEKAIEIANQNSNFNSPAN